MEIVEAELSTFTWRCRSLRVSHREAGLTRGLEPGEEVLVHDAGPLRLGHVTAWVADVEFDLADTCYRLELGSAVSGATALALAVIGDHDTPRGPVVPHELTRRGSRT